MFLKKKTILGTTAFLLFPFLFSKEQHIGKRQLFFCYLFGFKNKNIFDKTAVLFFSFFFSQENVLGMTTLLLCPFNLITTGLFRGSVLLRGAIGPPFYFRTTNDIDIKLGTIIDHININKMVAEFFQNDSHSC